MVKKICFFLFLCCSLFANEITYSDSVKSVYLDGNSTKVIGKLMPTTKLEVLEKNDNKIKIKVKGFLNPEVKNVIYFEDGKRILSLAFSKIATPNIKTIKKGENGKWDEVSVEVYSDNKNINPNLNEIFNNAKALYQANCSICHALHGENDFSANQWPALVNSMISRTPLTKLQGFNIILYLQKHSNKN